MCSGHRVWDIKQPSKSERMTSSYSFVSLYFHCERGNLEAAKAALQRGEDVNRVWQRGSCGNPFCTKDPFCDSEQPNINVNVQSIYNYTALNLACMAGKTEVVKQLLQVPSIDPNIPNDFGRSPLIWRLTSTTTGSASRRCLNWTK